MASPMKTTVQIPDALLAEIKKIAITRNTTLKALIDEGLRLVVSNENTMKKPFKMRDGSVGVPGGEWPLEGKSWEEIRDIIYSDRG
jgi:hypothetical protein